MKNLVKNSLKYWWMPLVSGVLMILLGVWVFRTPIASYITLAILFQLGFLISGVFHIGFVLTNKHNISNWKWSLTSGFIDVFLAFILFSNPGLSAVMLPIYIGFMLFFRSIMGIGLSFELEQSSVKGWGWGLASSILAMLFSFLMISNPFFGSLSIIFYTGFSILFLGFSQVSMAFNLNKISKELNEEDSNIYEVETVE
ncbi:HdeD family acid-resistance protein [Formosa sp. 3Alg 14/1]|uniref:HdeD family acid-resistance protein n=1 Tax=unclassified Formosa TaxID=2644710 RepID=UPI0039BE5E9D